VSLIGTCADCGREGVHLRFKPDVPLDEQSRPTICHDCRYQREDLLEDERRRRDLAGAEYDAPPWADDDQDAERGDEW